jgi:hypothetical protein
MKTCRSFLFTVVAFVALLTLTQTSARAQQYYPTMNNCNPAAQSCYMTSCVFATMQGPDTAYIFMPEFLMTFPYSFVMAMLNLLGYPY